MKSRRNENVIKKGSQISNTYNELDNLNKEQSFHKSDKELSLVPKKALQINSGRQVKMKNIKFTLVIVIFVNNLILFLFNFDLIIIIMSIITNILFNFPLLMYNSRYAMQSISENCKSDSQYDEYVSIVIPNKTSSNDIEDAKKFLKMTLESLKWFKGQVIVIDDSPSFIWKILIEEVYKKYNEYEILKRIYPKDKKAGALNSILFGDRFIDTLGNEREFLLGSKFCFVLDSDFILNSDAREMFKVASSIINLGTVIACPRYRNNSIWTAYGNGQYKFFGAMLHGSLPMSMGTLTLYNTEALRDVNGFNRFTCCEDFVSSFDLYQKGYRQVLLDTLPGYGLGPKCFNALCIQFSRWSRGGGFIFIYILRNLKSDKLKGRDMFRIMCYLMWYLACIFTVSVGSLLFIILPEIERIILYGIIPQLIGILAYAFILKTANLNKKEIIATILIGPFIVLLIMVSFVLGVFEGLLGKNQPFILTPKSKFSKFSKFYLLYIYIFIIFLILFFRMIVL